MIYELVKTKKSYFVEREIKTFGDDFGMQFWRKIADQRLSRELDWRLYKIDVIRRRFNGVHCHHSMNDMSIDEEQENKLKDQFSSDREDVQEWEPTGCYMRKMGALCQIKSFNLTGTVSDHYPQYS